MWVWIVCWLVACRTSSCVLLRRSVYSREYDKDKRPKRVKDVAEATFARTAGSFVDFCDAHVSLRVRYHDVLFSQCHHDG